ncbi:hypothetical protein AB0O75_06425 [Streptomyces sp. NPDC088921]|uniref:hypothetical protein n=1 Tax=unclassified Streptomyces TaxID=2593676 RepID=UPI00343729AA
MGEADLAALLAGGVGGDRAYQVDAVATLGLIQSGGGGVVGVDQALPEQQAAALEAGMDVRQRHTVGGGQGGDHVRDHVDLLLVTGLSGAH